MIHDGAPRRFATTRWSLVLAARDPTVSDASEALAELCRAYWYPLYAFLRRQGHDADEAQDLTQGFFAKLLDKEYLHHAEQARGRFRTFLLVSLKHYVSNERDRQRAAKRGGLRPPVSLEIEAPEGLYALEPRDDRTPESLFERRWALATLERAMERLRSEYASSGHATLFNALKPHLVGDSALERYAPAAAALAMSAGALRVATHRLRRRFRAIVREGIASTVSSDQEVDDELRYLSKVLAS
jgi:DNA-directed RNA polymerase specialized sigma24 family protein